MSCIPNTWRISQNRVLDRVIRWGRKSGWKEYLTDQEALSNDVVAHHLVGPLCVCFDTVMDKQSLKFYWHLRKLSESIETHLRNFLTNFQRILSSCSFQIAMQENFYLLNIGQILQRNFDKMIKNSAITFFFWRAEFSQSLVNFYQAILPQKKSQIFTDSAVN